MTTATIESYQIISAPDKWGTGIKSQEEDAFNRYWAEYFQRNVRGFNMTALPLSPETAFKQPHHTCVSEEDIVSIAEPAIAEPGISQKNLELIKFLDEWFAEPDDLGEEFWKEFCEDLERNRFTI